MSELDDLKAAVTKMATSTAAAIAEVKAEADKIVSLINAPAGIDPAAVEASAHSISDLADSLDVAVAAAKAESGV